MGNMKDLVESHIQDAGNVSEGLARFKKTYVNEIMTDARFDHKKVSIRELFDATVLREHPELDLNEKVEVAEAIGHSVFPYITKELINRELLPAYEYAMNGVEQLVTEMETTRADYEYIAGMRAISTMPRVRPGQNYPSADIAEKDVRIEIAKFGEILDIERELVLADQTGQILNRARMAGETMGEHRHRFIVETIMDAPRHALEEASSTALFWGGSARTVYATTHVTVDGQVNANLSASTAIGTAGMDTVYGLMGIMTDEKGRYITVIPRFILVHPSKYRTAWQISTDVGLESNASTNRGANFYAQKLGLTPIQSPYVGSNSGGATTDWYVGNFPKQTMWLWQYRPAVERQGTDSNAAFERDVVARFKYSYAAGCGLNDVRFSVKATA